MVTDFVVCQWALKPVAECHHEVIKILKLWGICFVEGHYPSSRCPLQGQGENSIPGALGLEVSPIFLHVREDMCQEKAQLLWVAIIFDAQWKYLPF